MPFPFEDEWFDVIAKARFGLALSREETARAADLSPSRLIALETGQAAPARAEVTALAGALGLGAAALEALALDPGIPSAAEPSAPLERLVLGSGPAANGYVLACPRTRAAFVVDPGDEFPKLEAAVSWLSAEPTAILLTHGHRDHVGALDAAVRRWRVPVYALAAEEPILGRRPDVTFVAPEFTVEAGSLRAVFRHVPGHTPGMACIVVPRARVAFTGDSLFARSLGRAAAPGAPYRTQIARVRAEILALPDETVLCPGHGPPTCPADERRLNPFFP